MNKEIHIESLTDYINRVIKLKPNKSDIQIFPEEIVFRGLRSCSYELVPSIARRTTEKWFNSLLLFEKDLVSQAQQKFPNIFKNDDLPTTKLAKLQHYGVPTRIMDVTSSALVALFFACQTSSTPKLSKDGEVIVFSKPSLPANNIYANIIADTYQLTNNACTDVENYYYRAVHQNYSIALQYPNWEETIEKELPSFLCQLSSPLLIDAFETSARQKNQQGKYIIFPNRFSTPDEDESTLVMDSLVNLKKDDPTIIIRYIIPSELKDILLDNLSKLGVTEEFLFADNVDIVFKSVKKCQEDRFC